MVKEKFPPLLLLRRYLKLVFNYCQEIGCLNCLVDEVNDSEFPFKFKNSPTKYPKPIDCYL